MTGNDGPRRDVATSSRKRSKVVAACNECRTKKIRCDGRQPVCSPCTARHGSIAECVWGIRRGRGPGASKTDLERLKRRVDELENEKNRVQPQDELMSREPVSTNSTHTLTRDNDNDNDNNDEQHDGNAMFCLVDDDGTKGPVKLSQDSSARSFTIHIKDVLEGQSVRAKGQNTIRSPKHHFRSTEQAQDYVLPSRHRADQLLDVYWRLVYDSYPFVDATTFKAAYQRLYAGQGLKEDTATFLCLLNTILAIACKLDATVPAEDREREADVFYRRGQYFFGFQLARNSSTLTVQCFLLLGQYLQSTVDPQQCWVTVGMAIRIAQILQLDSASTDDETPSSAVEIERRIWHGCVLMDRAISMILGKAPMITPQGAAAVPLPAPYLQNEFAKDPDCNARSVQDTSSCFVETLKLYELMAEILSHWYVSPLRALGTNNPLFTTDSGGLRAQAIGKVLELDRKLWLWRRDLPSCWQYGHVQRGYSATQQRRSNVLQIRHHHVRLLLFRPLLAEFCAARDTGPPTDERILPWEIMLQCCITCVEIALKTIALLHDIMSQGPMNGFDELLPEWWYVIFYLYSATTVLIAARLSKHILARISADTIMQNWQRSVQVFRILSTFSNHATRCATMLQTLFDQVSDQTPGILQPQHREHIEEQIMLPVLDAQQGAHVERLCGHECLPSVPAAADIDNPWLNHTSAMATRDKAITTVESQEDHAAVNESLNQNTMDIELSLDFFGLPESYGEMNQIWWLNSYPPTF